MSSVFAQADPTGLAGYQQTTETGSYGMFFTVAASGTCNGVWYYSSLGSGTLPSAISLFTASGDGSVLGSTLSHQTSPSWSGAAGSGWVKANFASGVAVSPGTTYVAQYFGTSFLQAFLYTASAPSVGFPTTSADGNITAPQYPAGDTTHSNCDNGLYHNGSDAFPDTEHPGVNINWLLDVDITFSSSTNAPAGVAAASATAPNATVSTGGSPQTLFGQPSSPATLVSDTSPYTMGMQFSLSASAPLTGIWFYSASGAGSLPNQCGIYAVSGGSQVVWNASATWSGVAGSGWVKCTFPGTTTLSSGVSYKVCVYNADLGGTNWYSATSHYWDSGAGGSGRTSGIITAPNNAGGDGGQDTFNTPAVAYPASSFNAANYWVDVEVTPSGGTQSAPAGAAAGLARPASPSIAVQAHAGVAAAVAGAGGPTGAAVLATKFSSTDGNGVDTYTAVCGLNGGTSQTIRVKNPVSPPSGTPHAFVYALPVTAEGDNSFGSGLDVMRGLGAHDTYNATLVEAGMTVEPWFADNPLDATIRQESYVCAVRNWAQAHLFTSGSESHYLVGFSKSGIGGCGLIFRNPGLWLKAGLWDWPADQTTYNRFDPSSTAVYGTQANFANNYEPGAAFLSAHDGPFLAANRIWIGEGPGFTTEVSDFDALLTTFVVPHSFPGSVGAVHTWAADWVGPALVAMFFTAGVAPAVAAAPQPRIGAGALAGVAAAHAVAPAATVTTVTSGVAHPAAAAAIATVVAPGVTITFPAGVATGAGRAPDATVSSLAGTAAPAGVASASGASPSSRIAVTASADVAAAVAVALAVTSGLPPGFIPLLLSPGVAHRRWTAGRAHQ